MILGGVRGFSSDHNNVTKWCLNRPKLAIITRELLDMAGLSRKQDYKPLRNREIKKSEIHVTQVINVLENDYWSPFSVFLEDEDVHNLSSGKVYEGDTQKLLDVKNQGKLLMDTFIDNRIRSSTTPFHDTIRKQTPTLFKEQQTKLRKKYHNKEVIKVNRDILGKLLSISTLLKSPIDFQIVLAYPLCPVPLSLAFPDGTKRCTAKSKLLDVILPKSIPESGNRTCNTLIVDLIAQYRTTPKGKSKTFEDLIVSLLSSLPKGHDRVDLVADCYRDFSIKAGEREKRGQSQKILIKSSSTLIPRDTKSFFSNGENKTQLIKMTFDYIKVHRKKCLDILKSNTIIMSGDEYCEKVILSEVTQLDDLVSDQEEADTKVVLHAIDALKTDGNVCIRSPSGDTDILVIAIGLIRANPRVLVDSGNGDHRRKVWLDSITLSEGQQSALIGFHAFSGNDYISAFFRKGKKQCWDKMVDNENTTIFTELGDTWIISEEQKSGFEKYICQLYGTKMIHVNDARYKIFEKKQLKSKQLTDLSLLPPCQRTLILHLKRANYVAKIWKSANTAMIDLPTPAEHGWDGEGDISWTDEMFPEDLEQYVAGNEEDDEEDFEDDVEGDVFDEEEDDY